MWSLLNTKFTEIVTMFHKVTRNSPCSLKNYGNGPWLIEKYKNCHLHSPYSLQGTKCRRIGKKGINSRVGALKNHRKPWLIWFPKQSIRFINYLKYNEGIYVFYIYERYDYLSNLSCHHQITNKKCPLHKLSRPIFNDKGVYVFYTHKR